MSSRVMTWMADAVSDSRSGAGDGADLDVHQLLQAHVLERARRGRKSGVCADTLLTRMSAPRATCTNSSLVHKAPFRCLDEAVA